MADEDWRPAEIETVVESYFRMLRAELVGQPFAKSHENAWVRARVDGRSKGSVEYKYQNISAALLALGAGEYVRGYRPAKNSQQALQSAVAERLRIEPQIEDLMVSVDQQPVTAHADFVWSVEGPREFVVPPTLPRLGWNASIRTDFMKLELERHELGLAGERAVVDRERDVLARAGRERLAAQVEHVSVTQRQATPSGAASRVSGRPPDATARDCQCVRLLCWVFRLERG